MTDTDGVLASIDACLYDYLSPDAMRWAPDEPDPTPVVDGASVTHTFIDEAGTALSAATAGWPVIRDDAADVLEWSTAISPAREVIFDAIPSELETPSRDDLLRLLMPEPRGILHMMLSTPPAESFGEIVLTIEPAVTRFTEAMEEMRRAAETALAGFGKTFAPFLSATQASAHRALYSGDRKHRRRCPTCNPAAFPKPLAINGNEYNRRRRRRSRR